MNDYLERYLNHLAVRGYSKATIYDYGNYLNEFLQYIKQQNLELKAITSQNIEEYKLHLKEAPRPRIGTPLSDGSYHNHLKALTGFFKWLEESNQILISPVVKTFEPRTQKPKKLPNVLTEEEVLKILEFCPINTPVGIRDRAMLEILYSTGIRRMELANLNVSDLSLEQEELFINKGKGRKDRVIPIGRYAAKFTEAYLKLIRPWLVKSPNETALFLNSVTGERLKTWNVADIVEKAIKSSGIEKKVTPHTFRHSMASHLLRNGADLRHIQAMLGHESVQSTEIYIHLMVEDLKKAVKKGFK